MPSSARASGYILLSRWYGRHPPLRVSAVSDRGQHDVARVARTPVVHGTTGEPQMGISNLLLLQATSGRRPLFTPRQMAASEHLPALRPPDGKVCIGSTAAVRGGRRLPW